MTYLNKLNPGQRAKVVGYRHDSPIARRLTELGLIPGRTVTYLRNAPLQDPLEIQVGPSCLSLRHAEASLVAVEVEEPTSL
ncbi:MAG: ferrous iron transport protein A [candidate division Zixibacteria bacterium]|nr:ferrous iron transport protein A [candidate division Zixibacteria bacterium]